MAETLSQDNRIGRMISTLAHDDLVLMEFSGSEGVNLISQFRLKALSALTISDVESTLGEPMMVQVVTPLGGTRAFHLLVDAIRYIGPDGENHIYEFELRPWFWQLSRRINSRIFHNVSVIDVIETFTEEYASTHVIGLSDLTDGNFPVLEYLVQYNESDMDFIRRLMERFGINFHFSMSESGHNLVLTTGADAFPKAPTARRAYSPLGDRGDATPENFESWSPHRQLTTGSVRTLDYNFKTVGANMESQRENMLAYAGINLEEFIYPGLYLTADEGNPLAKRRLDAHRTNDATVQAQGNAVSLGAGMRFNLDAHPQADQLGEYAVLSAHHLVSNGTYRSGGQPTGDMAYHGSYVVTRSEHPVAPLRQTRIPRIQGPQTAVVVEGAEGSLDAFGRIVVRFHWAPEDQSMRCRVSQIWSQAEWGSMFIPHIGMEVVVEFLEGDPDQPLITGCVYNEKNHPSFPNDNLTSGFKTVRNNQLFFYDTEGSEEVYIRAQRDMSTSVQNDDAKRVHNNQSLTVDGKQSNAISKSKSESVGGGLTLSVGGDEKHKVKGKLSIESDTEIELKVKDSTITINGTSIKMKAMNIDIEAATALKTKGGASAEHDGGVAMVIKAGIVNIN